MTGITRDKIASCEAKESVFSDLNHLEVVTSTSCKYEASFGFTEMEVFAAMDEFGLTKKEESYLKVEHVAYDGRGKADYELRLTNWEVRMMFERMIDWWFAEYTPDYNAFVKALLLSAFLIRETGLRRLRSLRGSTMALLLKGRKC